MRSSMPPGCLAILVFAVFLLVLPVFLVDAMLTAMAKLGLGPQTSLLVLIGIFAGGTINLPVKRIPRDEVIEVLPPPLFGLRWMEPRLAYRRSYTTIAVNVGGCVIPCVIAAYELLRLAGEGPWLLIAAAVSIAINTVACYWVAVPVPKLGIAMPPLVPALLAAVCGMVLARGMAPPVAFTAGVLGPLLGADLLHLRDLRRIATGVASIGGAGTFDGIVLSGLVATLLA